MTTTIQPIPNEPRYTIHGNLVVISGRISTFGGFEDNDLLPHEGLAIWERGELRRDPRRAAEFMAPGWTTSPLGLARNLNPAAFYVAARWNYHHTPRAHLQRTYATLKAVHHQDGNPELYMLQTRRVNVVDWGPNIHTGRALDLSPGLADFLGLKTGDPAILTITTHR